MRSQPFNRHYPLSSKKAERAYLALASIYNSTDLTQYAGHTERIDLYAAMRILKAIRYRVQSDEDQRLRDKESGAAS